MKCYECNGTGFDNEGNDMSCKFCKGTGGK